jgi:hypothetical protein
MGDNGPLSFLDIDGLVGEDYGNGVRMRQLGGALLLKHLGLQIRRTRDFKASYGFGDVRRGRRGF